MQNYFHRARTSFSKLPDKKQYIELVTATLTVPVLATAIVLNFNNLKPKDTTPTPTPTNTVQERIVYVSPQEKTEKTTAVVNNECKKELAPLEIASPTENEIVTDNPVMIDIDYTQGEYCAAVWSYRINDGKWSDYDDKSIALYNLPKGSVRFELRLKSIVTGQQKSYTRTFTYDGASPVLTDTPSASSSAQ